MEASAGQSPSRAVVRSLGPFWPHQQKQHLQSEGGRELSQPVRPPAPVPGQVHKPSQNKLEREGAPKFADGDECPPESPETVWLGHRHSVWVPSAPLSPDTPPGAGCWARGGVARGPGVPLPCSHSPQERSGPCTPDTQQDWPEVASQSPTKARDLGFSGSPAWPPAPHSLLQARARQLQPRFYRRGTRGPRAMGEPFLGGLGALPAPEALPGCVVAPAARRAGRVPGGRPLP